MTSSKTRRPGLQLLTIAALCLFLQACKEELYTNLNEREANLMVAALLQNGIPASRTVQKDGKLTIFVEKEQFGRAVTILNDAGLPKAEFANLGSVFKQQGLVASPVQERAQLIYALSEELSRTISEIDGVVSARVHVVLPDNDPLQRNIVPASASVFIRHEPSLDINRLIPQIKTLVANGIAGLSYEKVSVVPVAAVASRSATAGPELVSFLGIWMLPASVAMAKWIFSAMLLLLLLALGGLGYLVWKSKRKHIYPLQPVEPVK